MDDEVVNEVGPSVEALNYDISELSTEELDSMIWENMYENIILWKEYIQRNHLEKVMESESIDMTIAFNLAKRHLKLLDKDLKPVLRHFVTYIHKEVKGETTTLEDKKNIHGLNHLSEDEDEESE